MAQSNNSTAILSPEDLISQLDAIQLISAMWSADGELKMDENEAQAVQKLVEYVNLPLSTLGDAASTKLKESLPSSINLSLLVSPERGLDDSDTLAEDLESISVSQNKEGKGKERVNRTFFLDVSLPLRSSSAQKDDQTNSSRNTKPILKLHSQGLNWLNRSEQDLLTKLLISDQEEEEDTAGIVLSKVEALSEKVIELLKERKSQKDLKMEEDASKDLSFKEPNGDLSKLVLRTWYYLPSLSTKSKRDDLVSYAEEHDPQLTGFVLAGKPGLIVLEHPLPSKPSSPSSNPQEDPLKQASLSLSKYWNSIKAISWADIPAGHKKVSETLREEYVERVFRDCREMTGAEEIGGEEAIRGVRNNRNDLSLVEKWLGGLGIGDRLEGVLGADWKS